MASSMDPREVSRRKALKVAVSALVYEVGFEKAEESVLETLTEMLQSCQNVQSIQSHARRHTKSVFLPPAHTAAPTTLKTLQVGDRPSHPSHIPDHLPAFPDPHTYIRTLTNKAPVTEYQLVREKAASQKRDIERALTRFIAKTGETQMLFPDNTEAYPLIAVKPNPLPYLDALLCKEQDQVNEGSSMDESDKKVKGQETGQQIGGQGDSQDVESIDNPYLRPVKLSRFKKKNKVTS
ncbi:transcription initiation factor TFIID subunit 8-like isoform X2 [Mizuhopecten yessoensis]|uniref:transcription initiation factor TFIID subunit 8-like isoform X2 n=1 Tax=Mizuhopecten yessoensis TaxID=6573 RepID=UPI000B458E4A|nr:transcription initiation factor TFIID subunit 8-like isoform X2 [Mizuhopecten yessoensis]